MKCLKWQKVTLQLTWMSFLQNCEVCFNQESLPITYYNFHHKSLVRPKSKSPNWQGFQPISYKANFSQRDQMHLEDHPKKTLTKIFGRKLRSDFICTLMTKNNKHSPCNLHGWFSCRTVVLILAKKVTSNLPKFSQQNFGQTQLQILNLSKISIHK